MDLIGEMKPIDGLTLKLSTRHMEDLKDFAVEKTRFSRTVTNRLRGTAAYALGLRTTTNVRLENTEVLHDLGTQRADSYSEKKQSARLDFNHGFSSTFRVSLQTGASLNQNFYIDFELTPRDRDQLNQFVNLRINSAPFAKVTTDIYLSTSKTDIVSIHRSLSQNNRAETSFNLRPKFTYTVNERVSVTQEYGLNIEFTEFVFRENENFLDRNVTFTNRVNTQLTPSLSTELYYYLLLHDRGTYLRADPQAERLLDIEQEDRRNELDIKFQYVINDNLTLEGKSEYSQRRDKFVGSTQENVFTDGGVELGLKGSYSFGEQRDLKFSLKKVNRFGRFNSKAEEDYWVMDSSFNYSF
jgi:hypothetical protein